MMTLNELTDHRDIIDNLKNRSRVTADEAKALEVAAQMLSALIVQLDSQSISFTP
jgi:ABC-type transporter Mla subunit MlaD